MYTIMNKLLVVIFIISTQSFQLILASSQIKFLDDSNIKCDMYSKTCHHLIKVPKDLLPISSINLQSMDTNLMTISSTEPCESEQFISMEGTRHVNCLNQTRDIYLIHIDPIMIGKTFLGINCEHGNCTLTRKVIISKPRRFIDIFLEVYIIVFTMCIAFLMGVMMNWEIIKTIIRVPIPVVIGFCSQYIVMPLLSYCFILVFKLNAAEALALFLYGCSPGGTTSNNWTIIFNGDLDLSVILTFFSTISSLVMMPLWYYTLGQTISSKANITIPFFKLILNLLFTILPTLLGLAIASKFPVVKEKVSRVIKYLVVCLITTFFFLTIYSKFYIFSLMRWEQWLVGPLLPWSGFLLGGGLAFIARLPAKQIFTVSIETGLQNVGIPFLIVMLNFPSPDSDYALLPLIAVTALTGLPLWIALLVKIVRYWIIKLFFKKTKDGLKDEFEKKKFMPPTVVEIDLK